MFLREEGVEADLLDIKKDRSRPSQYKMAVSLGRGRRRQSSLVQPRFQSFIMLLRVSHPVFGSVSLGLDEPHQPEADQEERGLYEEYKPGLLQVSSRSSPSLGHVSLAYPGSPYKWMRNEIMNPGYIPESLKILAAGALKP